MGKGDPKARAKRNRHRWDGVALKVKQPKREKSGRPQREPMQHIEGAVDTLKTRCRRMGWDDDKEALARARTHTLEGPIGEVLNTACQPDEIDRLWPVWAALDAAEERYARHYIGIRRHAATMRLEMLSEIVETGPDAPSQDIRTDEEKARAAVNTWMRWQGWLGMIPDPQPILDVLRGRTTVDLVAHGRLTPAGNVTLDALRHLARVSTA